ncbi:hypothetical protein LHP98_10750 [Rhodobacter sp. Har01]|uniref:hypothetical protein n=1 Tax=Rhodobacter sp. Har01 TaxID=2883999 RepID=UPI001D061361|nr:hypothetical protein [Rhodobacter sp. Har01]MCB6178607.1 hypothetical protein [Rhodobacter sp. Har01]
MSVITLKMILALGTLGFVMAFAYVNMRQTERLLRDSRARREREKLAAAAAVPAE